MSDDIHFMEMALAQADAALRRGEFPVGCVIAHGEAVVVTGFRQGTATGGPANETDHAEMVAIRRLDHSGDRRPREEMTLYCTMEPCLMCFAAILLGRIGRVAYGYEDAMGGGTGIDRRQLSPLYRETAVRVKGGVLRAQCLARFQAFFSKPESDYWRGSLLERYTLSQ